LEASRFWWLEAPRADGLGHQDFDSWKCQVLTAGWKRQLDGWKHQGFGGWKHQELMVWGIRVLTVGSAKC
jgi:hypothetical protein